MTDADRQAEIERVVAAADDMAKLMGGRFVLDPVKLRRFGVGEIKVGEVYRTDVATWTVDFVSSDSMIRFRREDGLMAWFSAKDFAARVVEKVTGPSVVER